MLTAVGRCRLTLSLPWVACAWSQRLKLEYDEPLSNFAFKFDFRRYIEETARVQLQVGITSRPPSRPGLTARVETQALTWTCGTRQSAPGFPVVILLLVRATNAARQALTKTSTFSLRAAWAITTSRPCLRRRRYR